MAEYVDPNDIEIPESDQADFEPPQDVFYSMTISRIKFEKLPDDHDKHPGRQRAIVDFTFDAKQDESNHPGLSEQCAGQRVTAWMLMDVPGKSQQWKDFARVVNGDPRKPASVMNALGAPVMAQLRVSRGPDRRTGTEAVSIFIGRIWNP